jgi:hypothetical protein
MKNERVLTLYFRRLSLDVFFPFFSSVSSEIFKFFFMGLSCSFTGFLAFSFDPDGVGEVYREVWGRSRGRSVGIGGHRSVHGSQIHISLSLSITFTLSLENPNS